MKAKSLEAWIWVLIYGGIAMAVVGLWSHEADAALAWGLVGVGAFFVVAGVLVIVWRSRFP